MKSKKSMDIIIYDMFNIILWIWTTHTSAYLVLCNNNNPLRHTFKPNKTFNVK